MDKYIENTLRAEKNSTIKAMFVKTADENYALARVAYFNKLYFDFFWLSLHSIEKYFKAILLFNGYSSKGFNHDIISLYKRVLKIDNRIKFSNLTHPENLLITYFVEEKFESFLKTISKYGDPNNRYNVVGYALIYDELIKLDITIWQIRRFCRPFKTTIKTARGEKKEIDEIKELNRNQNYWRLDGNLPIERALRQKKDPLKSSLFKGNVPFGPEEGDYKIELNMGSWTPPMLYKFQALTRKDATPNSRKIAAEFFKWAIKNIVFPDDLVKQINKALENYKSEITGSTPTS